MRRRSFVELLASFAFASRVAHADDAASQFERHELSLEGSRRTARNAVLLIPKRHQRGTKLPLLILLHGLGETRSVTLGLRAWPELYGLVDSYSRLCAPPIARIGACRRCLDDARISELNASLSAQPFRGFAIVCPVTPNPHKLEPAAETLDAYSEWLDRRLLFAVREHMSLGDGSAVAIDGCSLGGYVAIEAFLRRPERFASVGMVQGAIGSAFVGSTARRMADAQQRVGARPVHLLTSTDDIYRQPNEALAAALGRLGVRSDLEVGVGAHDQLWLREVGTLTMLLWHDRQFTLQARR